MIRIYFDGRCEPNPGGVATYGFVVEDIDGNDHRVMYEGRGLAATPNSVDSTNNVAEYMGLIEALRWLSEQNLMSKSIIIRGDSNLIISQVQGKYKVKSDRLRMLHSEALSLIKQAPQAVLEWIPREQNARADELTNLAYEDWKNG